MNEDGSINVKCKYFVEGVEHKGNIGSGCSNNTHAFNCWRLNISCHNIRTIKWTTFLMNKEHLIEVKNE